MKHSQDEPKNEGITTEEPFVKPPCEDEADGSNKKRKEGEEESVVNLPREEAAKSSGSQPKNDEDESIVDHPYLYDVEKPDGNYMKPGFCQKDDNETPFVYDVEEPDTNEMTPAFLTKDDAELPFVYEVEEPDTNEMKLALQPSSSVPTIDPDNFRVEEPPLPYGRDQRLRPSIDVEIEEPPFPYGRDQRLLPSIDLQIEEPPFPYGENGGYGHSEMEINPAPLGDDVVPNTETLEVAETQIHSGDHYTDIMVEAVRVEDPVQAIQVESIQETSSNSESMSQRKRLWSISSVGLVIFVFMIGIFLTIFSTTSDLISRKKSTLETAENEAIPLLQPSTLLSSLHPTVESSTQPSTTPSMQHSLMPSLRPSVKPSNRPSSVDPAKARFIEIISEFMPDFQESRSNSQQQALGWLVDNVMVDMYADKPELLLECFVMIIFRSNVRGHDTSIIKSCDHCLVGGIKCEGEKVWQIGEPRDQLTGRLPTELGKLQNLKKIFLYGNQLTGTLPTELGNLQADIKIHLL
uniref:Uncharacterized protein n=1 Tax=Ditylum brightwellii TaxID=49249 RepID=A0A7S4RND5_9STRA